MAHKIATDRKLFVFDTMDEMDDFAVNIWNKIREESIAEKGIFTIALSGGQTPVPFYRKLGESVNPGLWNKTYIFFVDERFVSHSSKYSNYKTLKENLFLIIKKSAGGINPVPTGETTPQKAAEKYEKILKSFFRLSDKKFPEFDLILLGMGKDGHTASLFPGSNSLKEKKHLVIATRKKGDAIVERISLTLPVINNSKNIIFLVTGEEKAKTLKKVIENPKCNLPSSFVKPVNGIIYFLVDRQAASLFIE
ncbi:MAG: 6-phosphogluconolactonase [Candidatus Omnitrophica bacterium]|nr:6-phosphogluconolactonase [Candidatus Omnitrophota bacterium]